jgi:hypothetical protein
VSTHGGRLDAKYPSPVAENPEESSTARPRRARRESAVPRSVVMSIDTLERRVSYVGGALALLLAGLFTPHLTKNTWVTETASPVKGHTCAAPYHWNTVAKTCTHLKLTHPSDWLAQFLLIVVMAVAIIAFAYWRKRVGVAFAGFLLGLALGSVGLPFLILGGWLLLRALRLQRYGDATFFGSSRLAREQARAKREGRASATREPRASATPRRRSKAAEVDAVRAPAASKRYTPKKPPPRKR